MSELRLADGWATLILTAFDTINYISVPEAHREVLQACEGLCGELHALLSPTDETSDTAALSRGSGIVPVRPETLELLRTALSVGDRTGGCFDVTVGASTRLWQVKQRTCPPQADEVRRAGACRGRLILHEDTCSVELERETVPDIGGIGKGYIADRLAELLKDSGVSDALIDLGGNVLALGTRNGRPWRIGIHDPTRDRSACFAAVDARDVSVVTSSASERYFEHDGVRYHHIMDPQSGAPAESGLISATVVCPNSTLADALSTACYVGGMERARSFLAEYRAEGAEGVLLAGDGTLFISAGLAKSEHIHILYGGTL